MAMTETTNMHQERAENGLEESAATRAPLIAYADSGAANHIGYTIARVIIGIYFAGTATGFIPHSGSFDEFAEMGMLPLPVVMAVETFELLAAFGILVGFQTRLSAVVLALYLLMTSYLFNFQPDNQILMSFFWKDVALVGGMLMIASKGCGRFGLERPADARTREAQPETAPV